MFANFLTCISELVLIITLLFPLDEGGLARLFNSGHVLAEENFVNKKKTLQLLRTMYEFLFYVKPLSLEFYDQFGFFQVV